MFKKTYLLFSVLLYLALMHSFASAACEIVEGKTRKPFQGESLARTLIEKKSLTLLNLEYPQLNAIEKTFTGELQTCSVCDGKYIVCTETN